MCFFHFLMDNGIENSDEEEEEKEVYFQLPDLVIQQLFKHFPLKELLVASEVCRRWRDQAQDTAQWSSLNLGQNINVHNHMPSEEFLSTYSCDILHVTLKQNVPFYCTDVLKGCLKFSQTQSFDVIDLGFLNNLLCNNSYLRTLDLSSMRFPEDCDLDLENIWSGIKIKDNFLESLSFPIDYQLSGAFLKSVFEKNPLLEHLSLASAKHSITTDASNYPFGVFNSLKSLKLDISVLNSSAVSELLHLRSCYQLESLTISKSLFLIDQDVFGPRMEKATMSCLLQLSLMGSLVNLRLQIALTYVDVALVLFNCSKLETMKVDFVDSDRSNEGLSKPGVQGLSLKADDVPQNLRTVSFGVLPYDFKDGFEGLMELLLLCKNLQEVEVYPQSESGELPIELMITPSYFLASHHHVDPILFPRFTSLFFHIRNELHWCQLKGVLAGLSNLQSLFLLVDAEFGDSSEEDILAAVLEASHAFDQNPTPLKNLHVTVSSFVVLDYIKTIFRFWPSIRKLGISTPHDEGFVEAVVFGQLMEGFPEGLQDLTLYLSPLTITQNCISRNILSLRSLTKLTLPVVQFTSGAFEALVRSCPHLKTLKTGCEKDIFSFHDAIGFEKVNGLTVNDLSFLKQLRSLKECLLVIQVDEEYIKVLPSVIPNPPGLMLTFEETFVELKNPSCLEIFAEELRSDLTRLHSLEIIASVYDDESVMHRSMMNGKCFRPLVFANRCNLERLHVFFKQT